MISASITYPKIPYRLLSLTMGLGLAITVLSGIYFFVNSPIFASVPENSTQPNSRVQKELERSREQIRWEQSIKTKYSKYAYSSPALGVKHIKMTKYIQGYPVKINVLEINRMVNENLSLKPSLASEKLNSKSTIRNIANRENAIAAINGTYFKPQTGVPLGTLMIDGKLITGPINNRTALSINPESFSMGRFYLSLKAKTKNGELKIDNINQPRISINSTLVYTKDWGAKTPPPPPDGISIKSENNVITEISNGSLLIPQNGFVIVSKKKTIEPFLIEQNLKIGKELSLDIKMPQIFEQAENIISGGPYLVKDSQVYIDVKEQKLQAITGKNPRSAIGYTKEGVLILVSVDGRENASVGMTLNQLANLMKNLGCINAMNLDGGSSTVMYVKGKVVNSPPYKEGIAISNAFVVKEINPDEIAKAE